MVVRNEFRVGLVRSDPFNALVEIVRRQNTALLRVFDELLPDELQALANRMETDPEFHLRFMWHAGQMYGQNMECIVYLWQRYRIRCCFDRLLQDAGLDILVRMYNDALLPDDDLSQESPYYARLFQYVGPVAVIE